MSNLLVSIWLGLLRLILTFLHLVYSVFQYFDLVWALFKRKLDDVTQSSVSDTELYVSRFVTSLGKCPSHLAVIIGTESLNVDDFSNIVVWCLAAGISFVSFYDHTGFLKENESKYYNYLTNKRKLDPKRIILGSEQSKNGINGVKNGCLSKIHVNFLSLKDGKPLFVKCIESLCKEALMGEVIPTQINERFLDKELQRMTGYPDPDLAIVCGKVLSTFGFLPWQIRVTEFLQVDNLNEMKASRFTSFLAKYAKCDQRLGK